MVRWILVTKATRVQAINNTDNKFIGFILYETPYQLKQQLQAYPQAKPYGKPFGVNGSGEGLSKQQRDSIEHQKEMERLYEHL